MRGFTPDKPIPLLTPNLGEVESAYVEKCIVSNWVAYNGPMVKEFEEKISRYTGATYCVATNTGTSALHLSLLCLGVKHRDLVITTPFTFVSPVNTIKYVGADPVFIDISMEDWQMDPDLLYRFLHEDCELKENGCYHKDTGRRVPCILLVHSLGYCGDLARIIEIAQAFQLKVIEDAACAMGSFYQNKHLGTFGDMGCISFNGNKIITTSGGGAILTHDLKLAMKALHLSTQAKSSPNYNHDAIGYNYRMTGLSAALGLGQLESLNQFLDRKKKINTRYKQALENIEGVEIPKNNERSDPNCWLFAAIVPNVYFLAGSLPKHNIEGRTLWMPLQTLEMFSTSIFITDTNVVSQVFQNALSLPSSTTLTNQEQEYIIDTIAGYLTVK